jgi:hypothetical protein
MTDAGRRNATGERKHEIPEPGRISKKLKKWDAGNFKKKGIRKNCGNKKK